MKKFLLILLQKLDLFDFLKIIKDRYFRFGLSRIELEKRVNFYSQFIKRGTLCFDVGANYGNRTDAFLELGAKVVAIEPQPKPLKFLKRKYNGRIHLEGVALGSEEGKSFLFISSASTLTSMSETWIDKVKNSRFKLATWKEKIEVDVNTLDRLIDRYGKPSFCKIDVEGYELEVLKGLTRPIDIISFEFTIPEFIGEAIKCIEYLNNIGDIICNYSVGESLIIASNEWLTPIEFIKVFTSLPEKGVVDGDIYIKFI